MIRTQKNTSCRTIGDTVTVFAINNTIHASVSQAPPNQVKWSQTKSVIRSKQTIVTNLTAKTRSNVWCMWLLQSQFAILDSQFFIHILMYWRHSMWWGWHKKIGANYQSSYKTVGMNPNGDSKAFAYTKDVTTSKVFPYTTKVPTTRF